MILREPFLAMSQGHQENSAFPLCMGREKLNNRIVVKG